MAQDSDASPEIDTGNRFMVGSMGNDVVIMFPPRRPIGKADALNLAAYLVAVSCATEEEFLRVYRAILNT